MPDREIIERLASLETNFEGLKEDFGAHREERRQDMLAAQASRHENANRWMSIEKQNQVINTKLDGLGPVLAEVKADLKEQQVELKQHDERIKPLESFRGLVGHIWKAGWKIAGAGTVAFGFMVSNGERVGKWLVALGGVFGGSK